MNVCILYLNIGCAMRFELVVTSNASADPSKTLHLSSKPLEITTAGSSESPLAALGRLSLRKHSTYRQIRENDPRKHCSCRQIRENDPRKHCTCQQIRSHNARPIPQPTQSHSEVIVQRALDVRPSEANHTILPPRARNKQFICPSS